MYARERARTCTRTYISCICVCLDTDTNTYVAGSIVRCPCYIMLLLRVVWLRIHCCCWQFNGVEVRGHCSTVTSRLLTVRYSRFRTHTHTRAYAQCLFRYENPGRRHHEKSLIINHIVWHWLHLISVWCVPLHHRLLIYYVVNVFFFKRRFFSHHFLRHVTQMMIVY